MLSLDVKSLFSNVPVDGALTCFETSLRIFHYSDLKVMEFIKLTKHCTFYTTFEFDGIFFFPSLKRRSAQRAVKFQNGGRFLRSTIAHIHPQKMTLEKDVAMS